MSYQGPIERKDALPQQFKGGLVEGANIRTPCGLRRIEIIRPGDLVVTRANGLQPVQMVWKRTLTREQIERHPDLAPIRLKPRAIGPMMPQRDLLVAPDHRLLIPGFRLAGLPADQCVLAEARELSGLSDDVHTDTSMESVSFFQLVFDCHQVFAANGLPVESFLPDATGVMQLDSTHHGALVDRFPELATNPMSFPPSAYRIERNVEYLPFLA